MADELVTLKVDGLDALRRRLNELPKKLRRRALRNALAAGARIVRNEAQKAAPVLQTPTKYRKPGTVKKAIKVRTSKRDTRAGDVGVFVNVRPLTKGAIRTFKTQTGLKSAQNPDDPFYWRFLQFGTSKMEARPFLSAGAAKLPEALKAFEAALGPQVQKLDKDPDNPL